MKLFCQSSALSDYLAETEEVEVSHPLIQRKAQELSRGDSLRDQAERTFLFVRDQIDHSWDIQSRRVTRTASDTLRYQEGICYAKSLLLAALLRAQGIPAGFCYQRLTLGDTPDTGYVIHALNACTLDFGKRWFRIDARGNKPGIDARFSIEKERLAFPVRSDQGEMDYPTIFPEPQTTHVLWQHDDALDMYLHHLPTSL